VPIHFLQVFNASGIITWQEDQVQLEQFDMCLTVNMGKLAEGGFLKDSIEEMQYLIK